MAKQFDLRKQLKLHDKSLLGRLFAGVDEMCDIAWDSLKPREDEPIVTAWEVMGDSRRHFQVILQDVNELADPRGQKVLLEEMEWGANRCHPYIGEKTVSCPVLSVPDRLFVGGTYCYSS